MEYINCKIGKDGLYVSSKTPQAGYVETKYGTNPEKITYKKALDSIEGVITSFLVEDVTFDGKTLKFCNLTLVNGEVTTKLSVNVNNTYGNYTEEFTRLISSLDGYKPGEHVIIQAKYKNYTNKEGKDKRSLSVYINHKNIIADNGKPASTGFIPFDSVPRPVAEDKRGETHWNWDAAMDFWYAKYVEISKRIRDKAPATTKPSTQKAEPNKMETPKKGVSAPSGAVTQPDDDLPF